MIDSVRKRLAVNDLDGALERLAAGWSGSIALADAIDVIDARRGGTFTGTTSEWLTAANAATVGERGPLLRAIKGRTATETLACLEVAIAWRDPRLTHVLRALLAELPWSGARSRSVWAVVFERIAQHADPRFRALSAALPASWKVGASLQTWLTNRLAEALDGLATPVDDPATVSFLAELRATTLPPAIPPRTAEELLAAIYADPGDDGARLVYADWLQERGDVRGEFIALQIRGDAAAQRQANALLKQHYEAWLGPLASALGSKVTFRRGFPASGTVKFRHQRDVEQFGSLVGWATFEELEWRRNQPVRADQVQWARYVGPAMRGLRIARGPSVARLLAASRPWQLDTLELDAGDLDDAAIRTIAASPVLASLQHLIIAGAGARPSWLAGITRCPPHLTIPTSMADGEEPWLDAAAPTSLETLTFREYSGATVRFARDAHRRFG